MSFRVARHGLLHPKRACFAIRKGIKCNVLHSTLKIKTLAKRKDIRAKPFMANAHNLLKLYEAIFEVERNLIELVDQRHAYIARTKLYTTVFQHHRHILKHNVMTSEAQRP